MAACPGVLAKSQPRRCRSLNCGPMRKGFRRLHNHGSCSGSLETAAKAESWFKCWDCRIPLVYRSAVCEACTWTSNVRKNTARSAIILFTAGVMAKVINQILVYSLQDQASICPFGQDLSGRITPFEPPQDSQHFSWFCSFLLGPFLQPRLWESRSCG